MSYKFEGCEKMRNKTAEEFQMLWKSFFYMLGVLFGIDTSLKFRSVYFLLYTNFKFGVVRNFRRISDVVRMLFPFWIRLFTSSHPLLSFDIYIAWIRVSIWVHWAIDFISHRYQSLRLCIKWCIHNTYHIRHILQCTILMIVIAGSCRRRWYCPKYYVLVLVPIN